VAAFWEGHKKSSALLQKICWEEPEKRRRETAGRRNYPEAVPRKNERQKKAGLLNWEDRFGIGRDM
jgi:hypothetical protein